MAFYKEMDSRNSGKKTNYASRGSWDDEGTHYKKNGQGKSPSQMRFGPGSEAPETGWSQRPQAARQGKGRPDNRRPQARPVTEGAQARPVQGRPVQARPAQGRPQARPVGAPVQGRPAQGRPQARPVGAPVQGRPVQGRPQARPVGAPVQGRPAQARPQARPVGEGVQARPVQARPVQSRPQARPVPARPVQARPVAFKAAPAQPAYAQYEVQQPLQVREIESLETQNENLLSGRNPIREALKSGRDIEKLLVAKGELSGSAREIVMMAKEARIPVQEVERARLDEITPHHQGMLAFASAYQYAEVEDMLALAKERGEAPFLILLDGVTDPHNLGAVIRTAECAGAHGVIVPHRRSVGLTPAAVKASAGAVEHVKVARVVNLTRTIEDLQKEGVWFYAASMEGEDYAKVDFDGPVGLVIGAEGEGISRLVQEKCDRRVSLPMRGKIDSLNASVAAGILMYGVLRSRNK